MKEKTHDKLKIFSPKKPFKYNDNTVCFGFDIETYGQKNSFVCAVITCGHKKYIFRTKKDLQVFVETKTFLVGSTIVATNLGFDFLSSFFDKSSQWKVSERNGKIYSFVYYQQMDKKRKITFLDTTNFFPASVKKLGQIVNIPKLEPISLSINKPKISLFNVEYSKKKILLISNKPKTNQTINDLLKYCERDAYISYVFYTRFVVRFCLSWKIKPKNTIASISKTLFQTHYLTKNIKQEPKIIHDICFKAYYGGRTEIFKRGLFFKQVYCYDFNSLYPSVMINQYPDPNTVRYIYKTSQYYIDNYDGVSYVEGYQKKGTIPVLPVRHDKRLIFPTGKIKGYYTHIELKYAQENGFIINNFNDGCIYTKKIPFFQSFVTDLYTYRKQQKENNDPLELMTKLTLNSLYGKFAYNYRESSMLIPLSQIKPDMYINANKIIDFMNGFIEFTYKNQTDAPEYSFPIFSAYTTAYARIKLHKAIKHNHPVIYVDTDSIFIDKKLDSTKQQPINNSLGNLSLEKGFPVQMSIFVKPKFYLSGKVKLKGVNTIKNRKDFVELIQRKEVIQQQFIKYRSAIKSKQHHKHGILTINEIVQRKKSLDLEDKKRNWDNKKFNINTIQTSKPIHID